MYLTKQGEYMSGGQFDYLQNRISDCALDVKDVAENYNDTCTQETTNKIRECYATLEKAGKMLQRVDWFISGDDGEESFNRRWKEDKVYESDL